MKKYFKKLVTRAVQNDSFWSFFSKQVLPLVEYAKRKRRKINEQVIEDIDEVLERMCPDNKVKYGPFAGMIYAERKSLGSALVGKLLGCYEKELHPLIDKISNNNYSEIVDIGCAEGYYAVGFGRKFTSARVFAYDTNDEAISLCEKMAATNGLKNRLNIGGFCAPDTLMKLPLTSRSLIISDCEGYEKNLFTDAVVQFLKNHDVLIEVHDYMDIEISSELCKRFSKTHNHLTIQSIDDIQKARIYEFKELEGFSLADRKMLLAEFRPSIMEWIYFYPRY
jgi:precorrin-6B methylase 2